MSGQQTHLSIAWTFASLGFSPPIMYSSDSLFADLKSVWFDLKGLGNAQGDGLASARALFSFTTAGYEG